MKDIDKFLEEAKKFYKIKEYQRAIHSCNSALNIDSFNEESAVLKVKCFLAYLSENENIEIEIQTGNQKTWLEVKDLEYMYNELIKIFDANDTKNTLIDKLGKENNDKCLYFIELLKNNDNPSDPDMIEKKVKQINSKLDEIKKFAEEKSVSYAYEMIYNTFIEQSSKIDISNFDAYYSIPTMEFTVYKSSWSINYKAIRSQYRDSAHPSYHFDSTGIRRNNDLEDSYLIGDFSAEIDRSKFDKSLNKLYSLLTSDYEYYLNRYDYGCKVRDKLNSFLKSGGLFEKPKKRKYICQYLGIDKNTNDIYFTEIGDIEIIYKVKQDDWVYLTQKNPTIEDLEKYIDNYK